ncbi:MAG: succinate dehydrogenase cytochrome b subunit [Myxococcota bacterium]
MTRVLSLLQSTIGKKVVMAASGAILFGYVIGHLLGNLQVYVPDGGARINAYAAFLHASPGILWGTRVVLLLAVTLHVLTAVQLHTINSAARPVAYDVRGWRGSAGYASRTMMWSGPIIGLFIVYHLLHFTLGNIHPDFVELDVHHNVTVGFQDPLVAGAYIVAMIALGLHLYHGAWSMFQSVGINHPRYNNWLRAFAVVISTFITLGNVSIPVAVLTGLVQ